MKPLDRVPPTPEQLTVIDDASPGFWLVRGAAGSGKTTTAILRLEFLVRYWRDLATERGREEPVRVLVLTFNRTLRGYIDALAESAVRRGPGVNLEVSTFSQWALSTVGGRIADHRDREGRLSYLASQAGFTWPTDFLVDEVDYLLGRFPRGDIDRYVTLERTGRGQTPRVDRQARQRLLEDVVTPYSAWKQETGLKDWNDLAVEMSERDPDACYDLVIVDEAQDFSANQVRGIVNHLADEHCTTFIRDSVQRIYPQYFTWREAQITFPPTQNKQLVRNHRNTTQIAAFARPLVRDIEEAEDAALPDFTNCVREGQRPIVVRGRYSGQLNYAITHLRSGLVGGGESVAFLYPMGGRWQEDLRARLRAEGLPFVEITRESEWPGGEEQIALSTMYSAKGLEFEHVILLGYNAELVKHGPEEADARLENHRRLLAMAIGRARTSVLLGYKPEDVAAVVEFLVPDTYDAVDV